MEDLKKQEQDLIAKKNVLSEDEFKKNQTIWHQKILTMKNLPSEERSSTKLIRDLYKNRKKLVRIENSDSPYIKRINPLLKKDYWLSHALIKFLNYEYDLGIKF